MGHFGFFKRLLEVRKAEIKAEKDQKIIYHANELIKAIQESGRSIAYPQISKGLGSVEIMVHSANNPDAKAEVDNIINGWSVKFKPDFELVVPGDN